MDLSLSPNVSVYKSNIYEVMESEEVDKSCRWLYRYIHVLSTNVTTPVGVGTMTAGVVSDKMDTFLIGALQLLTSVFMVGWVWSITWGVELVRRSVRRGEERGRSMNNPGSEVEGMDTWEAGLATIDTT